MKKILFISNRNIVNTCGELRLVKNRAEAIWQHSGMAMDFIAFSHKTVTKPEPILAGGTMSIVPHKPLSFRHFSDVRKLRQVIARYLETGEYSFVVLSGTLMFSWISYIRKLDKNIPVVADVHGACEELIEFPGKSAVMTLARKAYYVLDKYIERKYLKQFDHVMAVSGGLSQYLQEQYGLEEQKIHIIPCAVPAEPLDREKLMQDRLATRQKYGIGENEKLFIYSGGVSQWQCVDETVAVFRMISEKIPGCKLLLLSGDLDKISQYKADNILVDSLAADQVPVTLPGGDFAFLLRKACTTNYVAYPNKFLEYVKAGLQVITTPHVEEIRAEMEQYGLGYVLSDAAFEEGLADFCKQEQSYLQDSDKRQALIEDVSFERRTRFFYE